MEIKINIPDDKLEDLKIGFKKAVDKPPELEHLNDIQFFKRWIKDMILRAYMTGKIKIAKETTTPEVDEDIVEVD
jgi:hypothetical protein